MLKDSIVSVRKIKMTPEEKDHMTVALSSYRAAHPYVATERPIALGFKTFLRFLAGKFIRS